MIELECKSCGIIFERRGAKRGTKPDCNQCREDKERQHKAGYKLEKQSQLQWNRHGGILRRENKLRQQAAVRAYLQQL